MKKTFLDNVNNAKTFLIYGNVLDEYCAPDLSLRDFDEYLIKLLFSRGYKHVVFYGSDGTKGEYVLDPRSARYFFNDQNEGIPLPDFDVPDKTKDYDADDESRQQNQDTAQTTTTTVSMTVPGGRKSTRGAGPVSSMLRGNNKKKRQFPGVSQQDTQEPESSEATEDAQLQQETEEKKKRVRYSNQAMLLPAFVSRAKKWMENKDPKNKVAVVFYNILTTDINQQPGLQTLISGAWENHNKAGNICIFVAPSERNNIQSVVDAITSSRLNGLFFDETEGSACPHFYEERCIHIGSPDYDEIKNLLRRLMIIGTANKHVKAKINYEDLEAIALRIMANSRKKARGAQKLRSIREGILEKFIEQNPDTLITEEVVDQMWGFEHIDRSKALEKMNRAGWEAPYKAFKAIAERLENDRRRREKKLQQELTESKRPPVDWAIDRFATDLGNEEKGNGKIIPHFVIVGPPGVGKTTFAQLMGDYLHEHGYIRTNNVVKVGRNDLTSPYIAGVPRATRDCVERANEGVLFIDEAHSLGFQDGGANHSGTGKEVISTLNACVNDQCRFCLMLAGYEEEMEAVFKLDPGFRGRFSQTIVMNGYEPDVLYKILCGYIAQEDCTLAETLVNGYTDDGIKYNPLMSMIEAIYSRRDRRTFRNAAVMVKLSEYACGRSEDGIITKECFLGFDYGADGKNLIDESFFEPVNISRTFEKIMDEMNTELIGLQNVKNEIELLATRLERDQSSKKPNKEYKVRNIILAGNPGTGKDKVAEYLCKVYYYFGLLGTAEKIELNASEFASSLMGGAQEKMREAIAEARAKKAMLFVNEAHELCNKNFDGRGALKALIAPMTDKENPITVVFAVYTNHLQEFLQLDDGLNRRAKVIEFEDYKPDELMQIARLTAEKLELVLTEETQQILEGVLQKVYDTRTDATGNAGYVVDKLMPEIDDNRLIRCKRMGIDSESPEGLIVFPEDIPPELSANIDIRNSEQRIADLKALKDEIQNSVVGYDEIRNTLCDKIDDLIQNLMYPQNAQKIEPGHYFFKGPAGTGKTTGAELFAKYLYKINLISYDKFLKRSASDMIGQYLGQTGPKTETLLNYARGKMLFIDEAYALGNKNDFGDIDSYKKDAIAKIVEMLDDEGFRRTTCVVFAGYSGDMDALYKVNEGFKSKVKEIEFKAFDFDTSMSVLKVIADRQRFPLSEEAVEKIKPVIAQLISAPGYSNGRTLRKLVDYLIAIAGKRRLRENYSRDDERAYKILAEDIPEDYREANKYTNLD